MQNQPFPKVKVSLAVGFTVLAWASAFVVIRVALKGYEPGSMGLFRYLIASIGILFFYIPTKKTRHASVKDIGLIIFAGVLGFGVYTLALNYGEVTVSSGIAGFIASQIPITVALFAMIFLKEPITGYGWLGMLISVIGVSLIALSHHQVERWDIGIMFLLISIISAGIYHVSCRSLLQKFHPIELTAYMMWAGTFSMAMYFPSMIKEIPTASLTATTAVIYLGIVPAVVGYMAWNYALRYLPAAKTCSFLYLLPILTSILGWLMLGEVMNPLSLTGGVIALLGAIIINQKKKSAAPVAENATPPLIKES